MYKVYQVGSNDTIDSIAKKFGISNNELININALTKEVIPGELIVVPSINSVFDTYTVEKGDNTYEIAKKYNVDLDTLLKINGLDEEDYIYPNQQLLVPKNSVSIYVTEEGDTLDKVSNKMGISTMELTEQNKEIYLLPEQLIIKTR